MVYTAADTAMAIREAIHGVGMHQEVMDREEATTLRDAIHSPRRNNILGGVPTTMIDENGCTYSMTLCSSARKKQ